MLIWDGQKRKYRIQEGGKRERGWYLKLTPENTPESILKIKVKGELSDEYHRRVLKQKEKKLEGPKGLRETILGATSIEEQNKLREDHFKKLTDEVLLNSPKNWSEKMICHICKEPKLYETAEINGGRICEGCFVDLDPENR